LGKIKSSKTSQQGGVKVKEYKIWSIEHNCWRGADFSGYTQNLNEAGIYQESEALSICKTANVVITDECMIPVSMLKTD
jgi:hypothetical protein